jgi:hypothetical protein
MEHQEYGTLLKVKNVTPPIHTNESREEKRGPLRNNNNNKPIVDL